MTPRIRMREGRGCATVLAVVSLWIVAMAGLNAQTLQTVTFDQVLAPTGFFDVAPGGSSGPRVSFSGLTLDGGVILNDSGFGYVSTTKPNIYVTTDRYPLHDGSTLPGFITGTFTSPQTFIRFDLANGWDAATFTLKAFDASHTVIATSVIRLAAFSQPGFTGSIAITAAGIQSFTLASDQARGITDFAIDTLLFMASSSPAITFDAVQAPGRFADVAPGGQLGPRLTAPGVTLDGGVVLSDSNFGNAATTKANLYATSDSSRLLDGSVLSGVITGAFTSAQTFLRFDIANSGSTSANFTVTAFDGSRAPVASSSVILDPHSRSGFTGTLAVTAADIEGFAITSSQPKGNIEYEIDTLVFSFAPGSLPPQTPTITAIAVPASSGARLSPGTPINISGTNLGTGPSDVATITIGGKAAPVTSFTNSTSLVAQVPVETPVGSTTVTASYKGLSSSPFPVTVDAFAPTIFSPVFDSADVPITATHAATPNTQVYVLAFGLGATNPPMVTGVKAATQATTTTPVQIMVGGKMVQPDYAGVLVGSIGSYKVSFKIPMDVPVGDQSVFLTVGGKQSNTVTLRVGPATPVINAIVNGATFRANKAAPNSFVSLFGVNFGGQDTPSNVFPATTFNSVSVLVNNAPIPLYFVIGTAGQINVVLPSELPESGTASVQVKNAQGTSATFQLQMGSADVGLFRIADPSNAKRNNGAVLFANTAWKVMPASMAAAIGFSSCDGASPAAACGQPAKVGDVVQVYVTGLGKATPNGDAGGQPLPTGSLAPNDGNPLYKTVQTPMVTIGGIPAQVSFSGIAPGNAGLYQINVEIPAGVQPGDDVPVVVTMPGSTDTVTIAIRA